MTTPDAISLRQMLRTGRASVWRYTGTVTVLFLLQLALAGGAAWVVSHILSSALGTSLIFDDAVDGDVAALLATFRHAPGAFVSSMWVCVGSIFAYLAVSWFTTGGLIAVLVDQPTGRREVARSFGAGGAASFFAFARLAAMSALPYAVVLLVAASGLMVVGDNVLDSLSPGRALLLILAGLAPAVVLAWLVFTIIDYARVDLAAYPGTSATAAMLRGATMVFARPAPLLHVALYYLVFLAVSVVYVLITDGHAMLGTSGAISLLVVRQGLSIVRFTAKVALIAGQVELAQTREPPPRRVKAAL
jgi:hypothetical protein